MNQQKKWFAIIFFVFLVMWLGLFATHRYFLIADDFARWVIQGGTFDWYAFPLLRTIGEIGYNAIGTSFFFVFPFTLFFLALLFILFLAIDFGYCNKWLFLALLTTGYLVGFVGFFVHDTPLFFLVSVYAFFYFRLVYKNQGTIIVPILLNAIMFFTREIAFVLVPFTLLALIKPRKIKFETNKVFPIMLAPTLYYPNFTKPDLLGKTIYDLNASLVGGINTLFTFHPANFFKYFNHAIFVLSFFVFFKQKDFHLFCLIVLTFLYVYIIESNPIFYTSISRYVLSFVPLHLFYVVKAL